MKFTKRIDGNIKLESYFLDPEYNKIITPTHLILGHSIDVEDVSLVSLTNIDTGENIDFSILNVDVVNHDNEWVTLSYNISTVEKRHNDKIQIVLTIHDKTGREYVYSNNGNLDISKLEFTILNSNKSILHTKIFKGSRDQQIILSNEVYCATPSNTISVPRVSDIKELSVISLKDTAGDDIEYGTISISFKVSEDNVVKLFFIINGIDKKYYKLFSLNIEYIDQDGERHSGTMRHL